MYWPGSADAGIRHYWRIEDANERPVIHTYELDDTTREYVATGIHREQMNTTIPVPLNIRLSDLVS
jgi:hypothetical protein